MLIFARETFINLFERLAEITTSQSDESSKKLLMLANELKSHYSFFLVEDSDDVLSILLDICYYLEVLFNGKLESNDDLKNIAEVFYLIEELEKKLIYLDHIYPILPENKKQEFMES